MKPKTQKVHQHAERAESADLQNELQKLTTTMQRLESKIDGNSCSFQQLNDKVYQLENMSKPQNVASNASSKGQLKGRGFCGSRGNYSIGYGRGKGQNWRQDQSNERGDKFSRTDNQSLEHNENSTN